MQGIGNFVNITTKELYFSGCDSCESECCDGSKGFSLSPLILEDFEEVYKNFPILFGWKDKQVQAYVMLNDGKGSCRYLEDGKCSIYDQRTPACKLYPVSPYFEHILIDTDCPSVNETEGNKILVSNTEKGAFFHKRLENFKEKREKAQEFFKSISDINNFKFHTHLNGMALLRYNSNSSNEYIQMHLESLKNNY